MSPVRYRPRIRTACPQIRRSLPGPWSCAFLAQLRFYARCYRKGARWSPLPLVMSTNPSRTFGRCANLHLSHSYRLVSSSYDARGVLAPLLGSKHSLEEYLLENKSRLQLETFDLVLCDSVAFHQVNAREVFRYQLVSEESVAKIRAGLTNVKVVRTILTEALRLDRGEKKRMRRGVSRRWSQLRSA